MLRACVLRAPLALGVRPRPSAVRAALLRLLQAGVDLIEIVGYEVCMCACVCVRARACVCLCAVCAKSMSVAFAPRARETTDARPPDLRRPRAIAGPPHASAPRRVVTLLQRGDAVATLRWAVRRR